MNIQKSDELQDGVAWARRRQEPAEDAAEDHTIRSILSKSSLKQTAYDLVQNFNAALTNVLVSIPATLGLIVAMNFKTPQSENIKSSAGLSTMFVGYVMSALIHGNVGIFKGFTSTQAFILLVQVSTFGVASIPLTALICGIVILMMTLVNVHLVLDSTPTCVLFGLQVATGVGILVTEISHALGLMTITSGKYDIVSVTSHISGKFKDINIGIFLLFGLSAISLMILLKWKPKFPWHLMFFLLFFILGILNNSTIGIVDMKLLGEDWGASAHFHDHFVKLFSEPLHFKFGILDALREPGFVINSCALAFVTMVESTMLIQLAGFHSKVYPEQKTEFLGVAIANIVSGFFGLLPLSLPIGTNLLGIQAGARNFMYPLFCIAIHALLAYVVWSYMRDLPVIIVSIFTVALAAYLIQLPKIISYWKYSRKYSMVFFLILLLSLFLNVFIAMLLGFAVFLILYLRVPNVDNYGLGDIDHIISKSEIFNLNHKELVVSRPVSVFGLEDEEHLVLRLTHNKTRERLELVATKGVVYQLRGRFNFSHYKTHIANIRYLDKNPVLLDFSRIFKDDCEYVLQYGKLIKALGKEPLSFYVTGIPYDRICNDNLLKDTWIDTLRKDDLFIFID